jgi:hypothetical protein
MRLRTTEITVGDTYTFLSSAWDAANGFLYPRYPRRSTWVVEGHDRSYPAATPPRGATVEVVAKEAVYLDREGVPRRASNYRGRPFALVRDRSGAAFVPIDPQNLYPADEVPDPRRTWLAVAAALISIPVLIATLVVGIVWISGPPEGAAPIAAPIGLGSIAVAALILVGAVRWFARQLTERRSEGILGPSLRIGLVVGAVMAIGALVRYGIGRGG